ncbi:unnamed protein product [Paramecium primaurelia]|uniref:Uncharacterized protein n=2 Tax=Paramecium TaxID=5884 RepID=A0A8S1WFB1_9CILI|nr:unnamed protein product [Paramecium primaurelia]CAD8187280.1 unnamed protein product [Paramecium pentaurelia]
MLSSNNSLRQTTKFNNNLPINFASNINDHINNISEKSYTFSGKLNQDDILSSFQWFYNHKEDFLILYYCQNQMNSIYIIIALNLVENNYQNS